MTSFVEALKASGISISDEEKLVSRLSKANDPEMELIKLAQNSRVSGVEFRVNPSIPSDGLTKAFMEHGFDGFTFKDFIVLLKTD